MPSCSNPFVNSSSRNKIYSGYIGYSLSKATEILNRVTMVDFSKRSVRTSSELSNVHFFYRFCSETPVSVFLSPTGYFFKNNKKSVNFHYNNTIESKDWFTVGVKLLRPVISREFIGQVKPRGGNLTHMVRVRQFHDLKEFLAPRDVRKEFS